MSIVVWFGVAVVIVVVVGLGWQLTATPTSGAIPDPRVVVAYRRARRRALTCVGLAAAALVAGVLVDAAHPGLLGLPLALAPGLAAALGLLAYALLPGSADHSAGPVTASLTRRTAWSYGSRRTFAVPAGIALALLAFLGWAGMVAGVDDQGRRRAISFAADTAAGAVDSTSSPFPGSYYGVPLAAVTIVLAVAAYLALRRIATTPTLPVPMLAAADRHWRTVSTRVVSLLTTAALLGYFGGAVLVAGITLRSAAASLIANGGPDHGVVAGVILAVLGLVSVVTGVAVAASAAVGAVSLRARPALAPRPAGAAHPS